MNDKKRTEYAIKPLSLEVGSKGYIKVSLGCDYLPY
jgi:hypothetical protein